MAKAKGFRRQRKQFRLLFKTGGEYDGFECLIRSLSINDYLHLTETASGVMSASDSKELVRAGAPDEDKARAARESADSNAKTMRLLVGMLVDNIVEWNLEDEDGTPIPVALSRCKKSEKDTEPDGRCADHADEAYRCDAAGLMCEDVPFVMDIIMAWMDGMGSVSGPLERTSPDGKPALEASLPME